MPPQFRVKRPPLIDRVKPWVDCMATLAAVFLMGTAFGFCVTGGLRVVRDLWR